MLSVTTSVPLRDRGRVDVRLVLAALAGLVAGIAAKAGDESGWRWAHDVGSYPAAWVVVVALIGWRAPSLREAAVRSAVFFAAMTVAYYGWAALVLHFGWDVRLLVAWLVLSATAVPATAAAAHCRPGGPARCPVRCWRRRPRSPWAAARPATTRCRPSPTSWSPRRWCSGSPATPAPGSGRWCSPRR